MVNCPECGYEYQSLLAAERCADDDQRKPRKNDWLDPDAWD